MRRFIVSTAISKSLILLVRWPDRSTSFPPNGRARRALADLHQQGFLILVSSDAAWQMRAKPGRFDGVRALDGGWLETALADIGLTVSYQHGLAETLAEVDSGRASAAVLIRPVSVAEIERTAREGLLMPPKSTFFTPKLKTGLVIRSLT